MRLIDADKLVYELTELVRANTGEYKNGIAVARLVVMDSPTVGGWISVKDRLPGIDEDVLIFYESKVSRKTGYAITCLKDSFYFGSTPIPYQTPQWSEPWQYFRENNVITHWMPLPEPLKEVSEDD